MRKHIENFVNQVGNGDFEKAVNQFVDEQTIEKSLAEFENALELSFMDDEVDLDMLLKDDDFEDFGTTDSLRSDAITQLISEIKKGLIDKKIFYLFVLYLVL